MLVISFIACLLAFTLIGMLSSLKNTHTSTDYLLAGRNVKPWLAALSAAATNNSGYMFVGMIGYTYHEGLPAIWLMIGWVAGDFLASTFIHKRLRVATEATETLSFAGIISGWHGTEYRILRLVAGLITLVFLGTYAAAQLNAGSKALHVLFGWDYTVGAIIGAVMVLLYCFAGGIRASIWTDAAQSFVMITAMALLVIASMMATGGWVGFVTALDAVSPTYLDLFPSNLPVSGLAGGLLFIAGWICSGYGVVGQPHVMIRFMAVNNPEQMGRVRLYYYSWYASFCALTVCVGLAARILLPQSGIFDAELALPVLSQQLLPEALVGLVLAGLFASTMSTADSQILSCSAALTHDFTFDKAPSYLITKLATVSVTAMILFIALWSDESVFSLVMIAWAVLACAFAPLISVYALGGKPTEALAIAMVIGGVCAMMVWRHLGLSNIIYEIAPGLAMGFLIYGVGNMFSQRTAMYTARE